MADKPLDRKGSLPVVGAHYMHHRRPMSIIKVISFAEPDWRYANERGTQGAIKPGFFCKYEPLSDGQKKLWAEQYRSLADFLETGKTARPHSKKEINIVLAKTCMKNISGSILEQDDM